MPLDLDYLLRLRLVVARYGEMDVARWWNTKGQLGRLGAVTLKRGFPRTHRFAQARSVFAVAAHRCAEIMNPPNCVTLWSLTPPIEEEFDARWEHWLDNAQDWEPLFQSLESIPAGKTFSDILGDIAHLPPAVAQAATTIRRSAEGRAVALPRAFDADDNSIGLLAAGFTKAQPGELLVPYARVA